jgi:FkbM family methyltransferase
VSLMTSRMAIKARSVARLLGLNKAMMRRRHAVSYERALADAMQAATMPGDVVWDIGANIGFYTRQFAAWTGAGGRVYAFEPEPATLLDLRAAVDTLQNVTVVPIGLSANDARLPFARMDIYGSGALVVTSDQADEFLEVRAGDGLDLSAPNLVKVDVEGHELDVLRGMKRLLTSRELRSVFVELHFATFAKRGQNDAPANIEELLKAGGFRLRWVDPSHLHAAR